MSNTAWGTRRMYWKRTRKPRVLLDGEALYRLLFCEKCLEKTEHIYAQSQTPRGGMRYCCQVCSCECDL